MFAKLLKHEWRDSSRILTIFSLAALGAGAAAGFILRFLNENASRLAQDPESGWVSAVLVIVMVFVVFGLLAYALGSRILLLYRFYKSKFTDEGYLAFTLPVKSRQIFLASLVNQLIWGLISGLVLIFALGLMFLICAVGQEIPLREMAQEIREGFSMSDFPKDYMAVTVLAGLVGGVAGYVTSLTCVVIGAVIAKRHKILAAFGTYYVLSMVTGVLSSAATSVLTRSVVSSALLEETMVTAQWINMGGQVALALAGFFLSTYLMEKKLNLP
jgi:hypothetical protein